MSRVLEIALTVLALVAVAAATLGVRPQEMVRAPAGTFPLQVLDPVVTSGIKRAPEAPVETISPASAD